MMLHLQRLSWKSVGVSLSMLRLNLRISPLRYLTASPVAPNVE